MHIEIRYSLTVDDLHEYLQSYVRNIAGVSAGQKRVVPVVQNSGGGDDPRLRHSWVGVPQGPGTRASICKPSTGLCSARCALILGDLPKAGDFV